MKYIGLDIGTTSICGVVFDAGLGEILSTALKPTGPHETGLPVGTASRSRGDLAQAEAVMRQLRRSIRILAALA